jgi:6-phospho-beta-glucosidase
MQPLAGRRGRRLHNRHVKLAIVGGGGFRVPQLYRALLADRGTPRVTSVALYDPVAERLAVVRSVLARQARGVLRAPRVSSTSNLAEALDGAQFVFSAIRVGGLAGRTHDERVALRLGVLGQETVGAGGIAYGLRTVPVAMRIAEQVKACCPDAYVVNFTNPAGLITEAMQRVLGDRVIGVCDTPTALLRRIGVALGTDPGRVRPDYVGLNHLGWMRGATVDGVDEMPGLLADEGRLTGLDEAAIFGVSWLQALGCVPNEYLYYYYFTRDAIRSIVSGGTTRGEFLQQQQPAFYRAAAAAPDDALALWLRTVDDRGASYMAEAKRGRVDLEPARTEGYEQVALAVMAAIARDEPTRIILNVRNGSAVGGLDPSAVVEVPATVDRHGARPVPAAAPDPHQTGLMQQVKAVERLTIEAAITGSPDAALRAFALHPLVDSVSVARDLLRGYVEAIPEVAAVLQR